MRGAMSCIALFVSFVGHIPANAGLITDGGFESASPPASGFTQTVPGWTITSDSPLTGVTSFTKLDGISAHDGSNWASISNLSSTDPGILGQEITTTTPGASYDLSYFYTAGDHSGANNEFKVLWNGAVLIDIVNGPAVGWTRYDFVVQGTGNDTLQFEGFNGPSWNGLDDVSLDTVAATVPEPASSTVFGLFATFGLFVCARRRQSRVAA